MNDRARICWLACAAILLVGASPSDDKPKDKKPTLMERKLKHAHMVLDGVAKNDFKMIDDGATGLLGCAEDAAWRVLKSEKYDRLSGDFVRAAEALKRAAKHKSSDSAALAYLDLTLSCFKCHQHLRDERK